MMFMRKILLNDINFVSPHGRMAWIHKLNYFKKMGYDLLIISSDAGVEWYRNQVILSKGIIVPRCRNRVNIFSLLLESLKRNLDAMFFVDKAKGVNVVYSLATLDSVLYPYFLKKLDNDLKWVVQFDNTVPLMVDGKFIAGNKLVRILAWVFFHISLLILKSADRVFVIKPELQEYLMNRGFTEEQLVVTGNGVEANLIKSAKADPKYSIDALFMGRINEAKGIYDMLRVLEMVKKKFQNFQLAIMGDGTEATKSSFKRAIQNKGLEKNVQFLGYRTGQEKFDIIKSSKIFLFLSETESVPIAPLEAVCSGLKTIVYDLDAYDMYKNNEVIIFTKNDHEAVAKKVVEIFENGDFGNRTGSMLIDKYDWNVIAKIEFDAFDSLYKSQDVRSRDIK
jgi:glycosyltransferase involved in cell wall biosynthesis